MRVSAPPLRLRQRGGKRAFQRRNDAGTMALGMGIPLVALPVTVIRCDLMESAVLGAVPVPRYLLFG